MRSVSTAGYGKGEELPQRVTVTDTENEIRKNPSAIKLRNHALDDRTGSIFKLLISQH